MDGCAACSCGIGNGFMYNYPITFRGYSLCPFCLGHWKLVERIAGREISLEEFRQGLSPKVRENYRIMKGVVNNEAAKG